MGERVVVVSGSTRGIGRGIALHFAAAGEHVTVHGLDVPEAQEALAEIDDAGTGTVTLVTGDLLDPLSAERLVSEAVGIHGRVDVLVNNAGRNAFHGVAETTLQSWQDAFDLNLRAAWLCSRAAAPFMSTGSAIVNISSNHAISTMAGCFPYNVTKAGVLALTQALAIEFAPQGIRANSVIPGWIESEPVTAYFESVPDPEAEAERVRGLHLTGRIGTPSDVAEAVWYLAGASQVTGTSLLVDGGRSALMADPTGVEDYGRPRREPPAGGETNKI